MKRLKQSLLDNIENITTTVIPLATKKFDFKINDAKKEILAAVD